MIINQEHFLNICFLTGLVLDIHIRSEAFDDPGIANRGGTAYIKVNGHDHSPHGRGHNVAVVDATTGNVTTKCTVYSYYYIRVI